MILANIHVITVVAGFFLTAGCTLFAAAWKLRGAVAELKEAIETARDEIELKQERYVREVGESLSAIRQKIHDVETWSRDTFVRRDSFAAAIAELGLRIEKRIDKLEFKMDADR
jgi:predicted  nucleic acid-binding Zn-ribbon protein